MALGLDLNLGLSRPVLDDFFNPSNITTATNEAWYDASDTSTITSAANLVSQWDDKSPNGRDATQGTGSSQPSTGTRTINGLNVMDCFESVMSTSSSLLLTGDFTKVYIFELDLIGFGNSLSGNSGVSRVFALGSNAYRQRINDINYTTTGLSVFLTATPYLMVIRRTGLVLDFFFSTGESSTVAVSSDTSDELLLLDRDEPPAGQGMDGAVGEIQFYSGAVSNAEINSLCGVGGASTKWGTPWTNI